VESIGHEGQTARSESDWNTVSGRFLTLRKFRDLPPSSAMKKADDIAMAAETFCLSESLKAITEVSSAVGHQLGNFRKVFFLPAFFSVEGMNT
jgi:hypothetical protein